MTRDLMYEKDNVGYDTQYPRETGGGIKCKNYEICEEVLPIWWYDCKGRYVCTNCDIMFGTWCNPDHDVYKTGKGVLPIVDDVECPVCLETKRSVSQPNCEHTICIACFKRCYYGERSGAPEFPYSKEIEDMYYMDESDSESNYDQMKWKTNYPLIEIWEVENDKWHDECMYKHEHEEHLQKCPICRL